MVNTCKKMICYLDLFVLQMMCMNRKGEYGCHIITDCYPGGGYPGGGGNSSYPSNPCEQGKVANFITAFSDNTLC